MSYKPYTSTADMKRELKTWSPSWGNQIGTRGVIYACELLEQILAAVRKPPKRQQSAWNKFFAAGMKAGKAPAEISKDWAAHKAKKAA